MPSNARIVPSNDPKVPSNALEVHAEDGGKKRSERLRARRDEAGLAQVSGWVPKDRRPYARKVLAALAQGANSLPPDPEQAATLKAVQAALEATEAELAATRLTEAAGREALVAAQQHEQALTTELGSVRAELDVARAEIEVALDAKHQAEAAALSQVEAAKVTAVLTLAEVERFQKVPGMRGRVVRWLVGSSRSPLPMLVFTMVMASGLWMPVLAQDAPAVPRSCDDTFADIYFMPNAQDYPTGLPPGMTQGLPEPHLHLPRALLQIGIGRDEAHYGDAINISPRRFCDRTAFAALNAFYVSTQDLAHRLGLAYDPPSPNGDQVIITDFKNTLVDDSGDREGTAQKGTWVLGGRAAPLYSFCLPPVELHPVEAPPAKLPPYVDKFCYATASNQTAGYTTGTINFQTQPFLFTTFDKKDKDLEKSKFMKYITVEDLNRYFAFLRKLASVVVINTVSPDK